MQEEQKWVVAGNVLFLEGGYQLSTNGKQRRPLNAVYVALTEIGFCFIVNHGVPSGQIHAVFRQATRLISTVSSVKVDINCFRKAARAVKTPLHLTGFS